MEEKLEDGIGKYIKTGIFMLLFERLHSLRGFENILMDLHLERSRVEKLADRVVEFDIRRQSDRYAAGHVFDEIEVFLDDLLPNGMTLGAFELLPHLDFFVAHGGLLLS